LLLEVKARREVLPFKSFL